MTYLKNCHFYLHVAQSHFRYTAAETFAMINELIESDEKNENEMTFIRIETADADIDKDSHMSDNDVTEEEEEEEETFICKKLPQ